MVNNSSNSHICSEEDIFTDKIEPIISNGVTNIGVKDIIPKGIGIFIWSWTDDEGQLHTNRFNNVLYSTESPFNILSATVLYESIKDDALTWVPTKIKYSIFTWNFGKYKNKITHS